MLIHVQEMLLSDGKLKRRFMALHGEIKVFENTLHDYSYVIYFVNLLIEVCGHTL